MKWINEDCSTTCSNCGKQFDNDFEIPRKVIREFKYCPNCGERSEGQKNNSGVKICPVCNKKFIPAVNHIYKVYIKGSYKKVCSWSCQRKWEKRNDKD